MKLALVNLEPLCRVVNSAALARSVAQHTSLRFERFSESSLMNFMLRHVTGEEGFAEVDQNWHQIEAERTRTASRLLMSMMDKASQGAGAYFKELAALDHQRSADLEVTQQVFAKAASANSQIDNRLRLAINGLAATKIAATVFIAVTPLGMMAAGAEVALIATASGVSLFYSVTKDAAKGLASGSEANVIAFDEGKNLGKEGAQRVADRYVGKVEKHMSEQGKLLTEAEEEVARLSQKLAGKLGAERRARLGRALVRNEGKALHATTAVAKAGTKKILGRAVPVICALDDVWSAIGDFGGEWQTH